MSSYFNFNEASDVGIGILYLLSGPPEVTFDIIKQSKEEDAFRVFLSSTSSIPQYSPIYLDADTLIAIDSTDDVLEQYLTELSNYLEAVYTCYEIVKYKISFDLCDVAKLRKVIKNGSSNELDLVEIHKKIHSGHLDLFDFEIFSTGYIWNEIRALSHSILEKLGFREYILIENVDELIYQIKIEE